VKTEAQQYHSVTTENRDGEPYEVTFYGDHIAGNIYRTKAGNAVVFFEEAEHACWTPGAIIRDPEAFMDCIYGSIVETDGHDQELFEIVLHAFGLEAPPPTVHID
jgi:hypothetical protein